MNRLRSSLRRIAAIARKDFAELGHQPGMLVPAALTVAGLVAPGLAIMLLISRVGERNDNSGFERAAVTAALAAPELAGLEGRARVQAFMLQQFLMFGLLGPVIGSVTIAAHTIIGEKQSRALEPLLSTPVSTAELLASKTVAPVLYALALLMLTFTLNLVGTALVGQAGVWQTLFGPRTLTMYLVVAPVMTIASMLLGAIVSSRLNDARSAQQMSAFLVLPLTGLFIAQLAGQFLFGIGSLLAAAGAMAVLDLVLLWIGVRVFDRETILMRWK